MPFAKSLLLSVAVPWERATGKPIAVPPSKKATAPVATYPELAPGARVPRRMKVCPGPEAGETLSDRVVAIRLPVRLTGVEVLAAEFVSPA